MASEWVPSSIWANEGRLLPALGDSHDKRDMFTFIRSACLSLSVPTHEQIQASDITVAKYDKQIIKEQGSFWEKKDDKQFPSDMKFIQSPPGHDWALRWEEESIRQKMLQYTKK